MALLSYEIALFKLFKFDSIIVGLVLLELKFIFIHVPATFRYPMINSNGADLFIMSSLNPTHNIVTVLMMATPFSLPLYLKAYLPLLVWEIFFSLQ